MRGVVELQLLEALAQRLEVVAVDREQAAEDHRLRVVVAVERLGRAVGERRDRLAAACLGDGLDAGDQVADLARTELGNRRRHRPADTDLDRLLRRAGLHEHQLRPVGQAAVHHPDRADDAAVLVVLAVEDQRLQRCVGVALRRGNPLADSVEQLVDALAGLCRDAQDVFGRNAEHRLDLHRIAVGIGGRQVDLVQRGDDLEVVLHRQVAVGQRLGLDPLGGVDDQHDALAGRQAAADLVAEVDVTGRVDEVQRVALPVDAHVLGLDGDAPLALQIHRVEVLRAHVTGIDGVGDLQNAVAEGALAVVDVGNDREVANT